MSVKAKWMHCSSLPGSVLTLSNSKYPSQCADALYRLKEITRGEIGLNNICILYLPFPFLMQLYMSLFLKLKKKISSGFFNISKSLKMREINTICCCKSAAIP